VYILIFIGKCKNPYCELEKHFLNLTRKLTRVYVVDNEDQAIKLAENLKAKYGYDIYLLDSRGELLDLDKIKEGIFIVGPERGFSEDLKRRYKLVSLSRLEFNHLLAKILLLEQIYRKINPNYSK